MIGFHGGGPARRAAGGGPAHRAEGESVRYAAAAPAGGGVPAHHGDGPAHYAAAAFGPSRHRAAEAAVDQAGHVEADRRPGDAWPLQAENIK
jgi:hypothetical protein